MLKSPTWGPRAKFGFLIPKCGPPSDYYKSREVMYIYSNINSPSLNHCCYGKAKTLHILGVVLVALVMQHVKRMRVAILSSVVWLYDIFPRYPIKETILRKKSYWTKNVDFDFSISSCLKQFSLQELRCIITNKHRDSCQVSVIIFRFECKFLSTDIRDMLKYLILW